MAPSWSRTLSHPIEFFLSVKTNLNIKGALLAGTTLPAENPADNRLGVPVVPFERGSSECNDQRDCKKSGLGRRARITDIVEVEYLVTAVDLVSRPTGSASRASPLRLLSPASTDGFRSRTCMFRRP